MDANEVGKTDEIFRTKYDEIAYRVFIQTRQDVIIWTHKMECEYVGFANNVKFNVTCCGKSRRMAVNDRWFSISPELSDKICNEIALQSQRLSPDLIEGQLKQAGLW